MLIWVSVALTIYQISFFSQLQETTKDSYNQSKCREQLTTGCPDPTDTSTTQPLHLKLREHPQRGDSKTVRAREPRSLL